MLDRLFLASGGIEYIGSVTKSAADENGWDSSGEALDVLSIARDGDLVVIAFSFDSSSDSTWSWVGMTFSAIDDRTGSTNPGSYVGYRFIQPGDSNPYVSGVTSGSWDDLSIVAAVFRGVSSISSSASATSSTNVPNPPLLTAAGLLWIATGHIGQYVSITGAPTNYSIAGSIRSGDVVNGSSTAIAYRIATLSSDNPGNFTVSFSGPWAATTSAYL